MGRVLAIYLDGYDHALGQRLMAAGDMPQMTRLAASSARYLLDYESAAQRTGLAGEHVTTGLAPHVTQRWSAVHFDPRSYAVWQEGGPLRPFAADLTCRTVVLDMPHFDLSAAPRASGVVGWGAHDPGVAPEARPAALFAEFQARFGAYPAMPWTYGFAWPSVEKCSAMGSTLACALDLRADATHWLLAERLPDWDLAIINVSEPHSAIEGLWHGVDPTHPLHHLPGAAGAGAGLRAVYHAVDRLVGRLSAAFPDAATVVFSMGGMGPNRADVQSMLLLPELLYRQTFGSAFFQQPRAWAACGSGSPVMLSDDDGWEARIAEGFPKPPTSRDALLHRLAARILPRPVKKLIRRTEAAIRARDAGPETISLDWMPAATYQPHWPSMPAFALPAFHDGRIRLNLVGRESRGMVPPENYRQTLDRLEELVRACIDPATGGSVVAHVERTAPADPRAATATQADLAILWSGGATCFEHPSLGRIGPAPYRRTGGHTGPHGVAYIHTGSGAVGDQGVRSAFDVVPTIIDLAGEPRLPQISGKSLLST